MPEQTDIPSSDESVVINHSDKLCYFIDITPKDDAIQIGNAAPFTQCRHFRDSIPSSTQAFQQFRSTSWADDADVGNAQRKVIFDHHPNHQTCRKTNNIGKEVVYILQIEKYDAHCQDVAQCLQQCEDHFAGKGYGALKTELADAVVEMLRPIQERYRALEANPDEVDRLMALGAERAREIARPKMEQVRQAVGLTG